MSTSPFSVPLCHGLHVAAPPDAERVAWVQSAGRVPRVRVRDYTCMCRAPFFELCAAGGLSFVRRISDESDAAIIVESPWTLAPAAERLWLRISNGTAW
ncbi:hypothetical protein EJK15_33000 [Nonomuraea basaltis]|nr:hypothetical protein EJK15_33000 [Nonomuraea basaltis]